LTTLTVYAVVSVVTIVPALEQWGLLFQTVNMNIGCGIPLIGILLISLLFERRHMVLDISFDDSKEPWQVKNEQSYVQGDGVSCGPIACLKVMEIYGFLPLGSIETIGESAHGYRHAVMDYYNECVSRYDDVLKVPIRIQTFQQGKQPNNSNKDDVDCKVLAEENRLPDETPSDNANQVSLNVVHGAGLNFAPKCDNFCFTRKTVCDHIKNNVLINNLGDYVVFPSKCFHQGYFNSDSDMVYVTCQLFARPSIAPVLCHQLLTRIVGFFVE
jgi:hypothetical protein